MIKDENGNLIPETTLFEAICEGYAHPLSYNDYIDNYELAATIASMVRMTGIFVSIFGIIIMCAFNRMADNKKIKIFSDETGHWQLWDKIAKKWKDE